MFPFLLKSSFSRCFPTRYHSLFLSPFKFNFSSLNEFGHIVSFFQKLSDISSRKELTLELKDYLTQYLEKPDKQLTMNMIRLLTGYIEKAKDLQIGPSTLNDIVANLFPVSKEQITQDLKTETDIGILASEYMKKYTNKEEWASSIRKPLDLGEILGTLAQIAVTKGKKSKEIKLKLLIGLCKRCQNEKELMFLLRILKKNLRLGYSHLTVFKALELIQNEGNISNFDVLLSEMERDIFGFRMEFNKQNTIKIGTPLAPMKGRAIEEISDIFNLFKKYDGKALCEIKYDGERAQIHYTEGEILSFSRNFEPQTAKYPNVLSALKTHLQSIGVKNCIIDCEIVGFDYSKSEMLSFQELMTKKGDSHSLEGKIYYFDLYYMNGQSMTNEPLPIRRARLLEAFKGTEFFTPAEGFELDLNAASQEETLCHINDFLSESLQQGYEGIFLKTMDQKLSLYNGNSRMQWIKVKRSSLKSELADTLDLVPIAGFWGKGKRKGTFGTYLLAAYNPKTDSYEAVCKLGTGFSDEFLKVSAENLAAKGIKSQPQNYFVHDKLKPDMWFEPSQVWEVTGDSFTLSNVYSIGKENFDNKGISLRFPRFVKKREDKAIGQATEVGYLVDLFRNQKKIK